MHVIHNAYAATHTEEHVMNDLSEEEKAAIAKLLMSGAVHNLMGAEEWTLTEAEEGAVWDVIARISAISPIAP